MRSPVWLASLPTVKTLCRVGSRFSSLMDGWKRIWQGKASGAALPPSSYRRGFGEERTHGSPGLPVVCRVRIRVGP